MTRVLAGLLILTAAACTPSTAPEPHAEGSASVAAALAAGPVRLTLRHGQEQRVGGSTLRLGFTRVVSDSRCPIDAICVWMGDGVVEVALAAGTGLRLPLELHTAQEPRSAVWNGVRVTLLELSPAPRASEPTPTDRYAVRLQVERTER